MNEEKVINILIKDLKFSQSAINKLKIFHDFLLQYNKKYNLISKSTEKNIWFRHILDSAQLFKFFNNKKVNNIADFGSGAGFPGLIIAIRSENELFHVKLYEKSMIKRNFLNNVKERLKIKNLEINGNIYEENITSNIIICRAFKKLEKIMEISREIVKKPHRMIILKGKSAQTEINNVYFGHNYSYKLENSITDQNSKIILVDAK